MTEVLCWGIAGAGKISHDFVKATTKFAKGQHKFVAVASKNADKAAGFAKEFNIEAAYGSYEELALDSNVCIVYVGNLHSQHYSTVRLMLEHGKHVLCEKSFMLSLAQAKDILRLARKKQLFCMEAIWSRFNPVYQRIRTAVCSDEIGEVRFIRAEFGKDVKGRERFLYKELGGGCLLDMGVYPVQLATMLMNESPVEIKAVGELYESGTDKWCSGSARYANGALFTFTSNTALQLCNTADIIGTKGRIHVPEYFHVPSAVVINGHREEFPIPQDDFCFNDSAALSYEADAVRQAVLDGKLEHELHPHRHTEIIAAFLDECRRQIGFLFESELPEAQ